MGKEGDNSKQSEPDFVLASDIVLQNIPDAEGTKSKALGDISAAWKRVEKEAGCNKKAMKDLNKIRNMSPGHQQDYFRTFFGAFKHMKLSVNRDMVDIAEGAKEFTIPLSDPPKDEGDLA